MLLKLSPPLAILLLLASAPPGEAQVEKSVYKLGLVSGEKGRRHESDEERRLREEVLHEVIEAFVASRRFTVVERSQLNAVFTEKSLQEFIGGQADSRLADVLGLDILGIVDYTVETSKSPQGGLVTKWIIDVRLVDVKTASTLGSIRSDRPNLYQSIRAAFPPLGRVLSVHGKEIVVDLGSELGLKAGDTLEIVEEGEQIIHPVTGKVLSAPMKVIGELKIVTASAQFSTCKLKSKGEPPLASLVRLKGRDSSILKWMTKIPHLGKKRERGMELLEEPNVTIEVRSLESPRYFVPAEGSEVELAWTAPPGQSSDVRLRAFSFKPRTYFCTNARAPAVQSSFRWSSDLFAPAELGREDLGFIAWIELPGSAGAARTIHLPLRVGTDAEGTSGTGYQVSLVPSERLNEVRLTIGRLDAKGNVVAVLRRNEELGYGYYPSNKPTVFSTGRLGPAGFYRLTISAIPKSGLSVVQDLDLYHPGD